MPMCPLCYKPRQEQKFAFRDLNIEKNALFLNPKVQCMFFYFKRAPFFFLLEKGHFSLRKKGTFHLEKGHFLSVGFLGGGGGGKCPPPPVPATAVVHNIWVRILNDVQLGPDMG